MKTCSIMQPTFLPWAGYFSLIASSDVFYFLDDVQLEKQSWQTRNRILLNGDIALTSAPVYQRQLSQMILDTEIDDRTKWREKLCKTLEMNYRKAPYFSEIVYVQELILNLELKNLSQLNIMVITETVKRLGLPTEILISSQVKEKSSQRTSRLVDLCLAAAASTYLSPTGAKEYLIEDRFNENGKVALKIFSFTPKSYPQLHKSEFIPSLSFVDIVANLGMKKFLNYIKDSESVSIQAL